jgi:predicted lipoprotein with Yx(FWY)xxD motif
MRSPFKFLVLGLASALLLAACGSSSSSSGSTSQATAPATTATPSSVALVKTASNSSLGATVLVNAQGMTLYSLSGEKSGHWICTSSSCVGVWHPVTAPPSGTPSGAESLGTVTRPDGSTQVTYKGMPLYTFAEDTQPGQDKGEGIKDVGTWMAVTVSPESASSSSAPAASTQTEPAAPASGGGGGYGY